MYINKVLLCGFVGRDPQIRYIDQNIPVANIQLATNEYRTNSKGIQITHTEWHHIVLWKALAELAEKHIVKGTELFVEGHLRANSWRDKNGNKHSITQIIGENIQFSNADSKKTKFQENINDTQNDKTIRKSLDAIDDVNDLPF